MRCPLLSDNHFRSLHIVMDLGSTISTKGNVKTLKSSVRYAKQYNRVNMEPISMIMYRHGNPVTRRVSLPIIDITLWTVLNRNQTVHLSCGGSTFRFMLASNIGRSFPPVTRCEQIICKAPNMGKIDNNNIGFR